MSSVPTPEEIYERTKEEGRRRLGRPVLEEISTALAAGFDIVAGLVVLGLLQSHLEHAIGRQAAHVVGAAGFGVSFVFLVVTTHGVLPYGTGGSIVRTAEVVHANGVLARFMSAVFAGALITAMTWFVEGQQSPGVRVAVAWIVGSIIALGYFNHVIVETIELIFGYRYGAHYPWTFIAGNFGLATVGNMLGGIGLVTLNRFTQGGARRRASA